MTILKAPIYGLDEKLNYGKVGDIIWDGKKISTEPRSHPKLKGILQPYELSTESGVERFDPEKSPLAWIKNLCRYYLSVEVRAYRANEVRPLKPLSTHETRNRWSQAREAK